MVASRRYSEGEAAQIESLKKATGLIKNSLTKAEESLGLTIHGNGQYRIQITVPSEYKLNSTTRNLYPIDLLKTKPDGSPESLVQVLVKEEPNNPNPDDYQEMRIKEQQNKFPDLTLTMKGESRQDSQMFRTSFAYTYSWEGAAIKALIHLYKTDGYVYEIVCTALAESFDAQNFEKIIKTFRR